MTIQEYLKEKHVQEMLGNDDLKSVFECYKL